MEVSSRHLPYQRRIARRYCHRLVLCRIGHIDGSRQKNSTSLLCYHCHQPGHKVTDCPLNFDIQAMTIEEVEMELMVKKDMVQVGEQSPVLEEITKSEEGFVQDDE